MKLAIDNQISKYVVQRLKQHYEVVRTAGNDPDEIWLNDALDLGADVFISPDLDVPNFLDKAKADDAVWIDVPQKLSIEKQFTFLMKKLKGLEP
jgi:hypothetical protein